MLKLPGPNVATETHTVYLSCKDAYGLAVLLATSYNFQAHASWLSKKPSCTKILLMLRMWLAVIALNYSVENIQNDICQKIYNII